MVLSLSNRLEKSGAILMASLLVVSPLPLRAGDLNAEVNT